MPNKQYYVLKDAKTEPPGCPFEKFLRDYTLKEASKYLTPCTEPLFTMEEMNEYRNECERLAKIVKFWQEEYYKVKPGFKPPKIDNL